MSQRGTTFLILYLIVPEHLLPNTCEWTTKSPSLQESAMFYAGHESCRMTPNLSTRQSMNRYNY